MLTVTRPVAPIPDAAFDTITESDTQPVVSHVVACTLAPPVTDNNPIPRPTISVLSPMPVRPGEFEPRIPDALAPRYENASVTDPA
eukprot:1703508-Rhodomonas_salina.2